MTHTSFTRGRRASALALVLLLAALAGWQASHLTSGHAASGTFTQFTYNGSAGSRPYFVYVPAGYSVGTSVPLVVMLHGCTQTPTDFAAGTQMNALADSDQFIVVYPQQTSTYNSSECWNWFLTADQQRGSGEPAIIAGITQAMIGDTAHYTIDSNRVFVTGMSAGAAMAVVMGATYPDLYAAIGEESGLEYQAATDQTSANTALRQGGPNPQTQGQAAYNAMGSRARVVPVISFQGTADYIVYPVNGDQVTQQWMATDQLASSNTYDPSFNSPSSTFNGQVSGSQGRAYTVRRWNDNNGNEIQEYWTVTGMGHAWSGGSTAGSFTDPNGPSASQNMYAFFLAHPFGPTVSASPAGGSYSSAQTVTLTASPSGSTIYYTTDGSTPTTSSAKYSGPLTISQTTTLKYFAVDASGHSSAVHTDVYTITNPGPIVSVSPAGSTFGGPVTVTLSGSPSGTVIHYTTDGSTPTASSPTYSAPLQFTATTTLKYIGVNGGNTSPVQTQTYTISTIAITAAPPGGTYSSAQSVSLSMNMPGTIYFTTDGSAPATSSAQYAGPIKVSASETIRYLGADTVGNQGGSGTQAYSITAPPPITTVTFKSIGAEDGYVYQYSSDGVPNSTNPYLELGSTSLNHGEVAIVSFDTSSLPAGATIVSASLTLYRYDAFIFYDDLGLLTADIAPATGFSGDYALDQADYGAAAALTNVGNFNAVPTAQYQAITDAVAQGALQYINRGGHTQLRVHFQKTTNNDYAIDVLHFFSGDSGGAYVPVLTIQYQ